MGVDPTGRPTTLRGVTYMAKWPVIQFQNALERGPKAPLVAFEIRRRPTLPGTLVPSTIGAGGLNCRVQNGNGCDPAAIATENRLRPCRRTSRDTILLSRAADKPLQHSTANTNIDNSCRCVTKPSAD